MARLPYLDENDLADDDKEIVKRPINLNRALAHSPDAARKFGGLGNYIRFGSSLDPRLREMAILQVGYLTKSPYEYSHHLKIGRDFGVAEADVLAIETETKGGNSGLSELDRSVLRGAREMTERMQVSDDTYAVWTEHLSEAHIVDLVMVIAFYNGVVRLLGALEIDVEPEYAAELEKHPLPQNKLRK